MADKKYYMNLTAQGTLEEMLDEIVNIIRLLDAINEGLMELSENKIYETPVMTVDISEIAE